MAADPQIDGTDFFAFISPEDNGTVTFIADYYPQIATDPQPQPPAADYRFADDALYAIKIDNNGDANADLSFEVQFKTVTRDPNLDTYATGAITSLDDPSWNIRQTYSVWRVDGTGRQLLGQDLPVAAINLGPVATPNYDGLAQAAVRPLSNGGMAFAGIRDEPFWTGTITLDEVELGQKPANAGRNVLAIALQIPIDQLTADGQSVADMGAPTP